MADLQAIADELQAEFDKGTWHEALIPHLADVIEVEHHPTRGPGDGPTEAATLIAAMRSNDHGGVLRNPRQVVESIVVEGDNITATQVVLATLPNDDPISIPLTQVFGFRDGRLVSIDHYTNPADTDALLKAAGETAGTTD